MAAKLLRDSFGAAPHLLAAFVLGVVVGSPAARLNALPPPLELPRGTVDVRVEPRSTWTPTVAPVFVNIPKMSATFVAAENQTNLAITFSAEAAAGAGNKRLVVRALVDGVVASPADVVFTEGWFVGARSFTFTDIVDKGVHTVEMQWLVDAGATASLRGSALLLRHGTAVGPQGTVTHRTSPSGPLVQTSSSSWVPVPGMTVSFFAPAGAKPIVSFSAETLVTGTEKRMAVRALIDGVPLAPGDVIFARRASRQTHRMSFGRSPLAEGWYTASIQWLVDAGGVAQMGDRTIVVNAFSNDSFRRHDLIVPPSGAAVSTSSSNWTQVPGLSTLVAIPRNGEIAVSFSGEVHVDHGARLEMRLRVHETAGPETAVLAQVSHHPAETQSFTFDRKHVFLPGDVLTGLQLEWRAIGGAVFMGDRVLELVMEPGLIPDLAEAPEIGEDNKPVEAAIGTRKVLTIIHRVQRDPPHDVIPSVAQVTDALFGPPSSMADYYDKVSGGRFRLENAGVFAYDAKKSESHYWAHAPFNCEQPLADGFRGGHVERWAESITLARNDVDFASFDRDRDGVLQPHELAILIIAPQEDTRGFTRSLKAFCSEDPFMVDGVVVPMISEWFTSSPSTNWEVPTHELAHLLLGLGDMYIDDFTFNTEAGTLSLLGDVRGTESHPDAVHKLALGWLTPYYARQNGTYSIQAVRESGEAVVLPRHRDGDGKEFYVLENRQSMWSLGLYDYRMSAQGIIIWHVVEDPARNAKPPACTSDAVWAKVSSNLRRGVRVLRPGINFATGTPSSWDANDYVLSDGPLMCPGNGPPARNSLLWWEGTSSGWRIGDFSAPGSMMNFTLVVVP